MKIIIIVAVLIIIAVVVLLLTTSKNKEPQENLSNVSNNSGISAVTIEHHEEEGGWQKYTAYPSGFIRFEGHPSGRGYIPELENGWYKVENTEYYQILFDKALVFVKEYPSGGSTPEISEEEFGPPGKIMGYRKSSIVVVDGKDITYGGDIWRHNSITNAVAKPFKTDSPAGETTVVEPREASIEKFSDLSEEPKGLYGEKIVNN